MRETINCQPKGKIVFVIGAGATGRAVVVEALQTGCKEVWIGNRTQENAWAAIDQIAISLINSLYFLSATLIIPPYLRL